MGSQCKCSTLLAQLPVLPLPAVPDLAALARGARAGWLCPPRLPAAVLGWGLGGAGRVPGHSSLLEAPVESKAGSEGPSTCLAPSSLLQHHVCGQGTSPALLLWSRGLAAGCKDRRSAWRRQQLLALLSSAVVAVGRAHHGGTPSAQEPNPEPWRGLAANHCCTWRARQLNCLVKYKWADDFLKKRKPLRGR